MLSLKCWQKDAVDLLNIKHIKKLALGDQSLNSLFAATEVVDTLPVEGSRELL